LEIRSGVLRSLEGRLIEKSRTSRSAHDLSQAKTLLLASDYGGEHGGSRYRSYSFVLVDQASYAEWKVGQARWRGLYLPDGRRLSFKGLGDVKKGRALRPFLGHANSLRGLILSLLVDRRLGPIVEMDRESERADQISGKSDDEHALAVASKRWRADVWNKVLTIATTVGVMLSAFSRPDQHLVWITDDDAIAPNEAGLRDFVTISGYVIGALIPHGLGHLRIGAASVTDDGSRALEDLTALADLASGALAEQFTAYARSGLALSTRLIAPPPSSLSRKTHAIMGWYSESGQRFERHTFVIDPGPGYPREDRVTLRTIRFHGTDGP